MSDKIMVELTEAEIRALLDDEGRLGVLDAACDTLRAALPTKWPNGTLAYVWIKERKYGPMHRMDGGWSDDPDRDYYDVPDDNATKVEPVRIVPADHISIPRSALSRLDGVQWRDEADLVGLVAHARLFRATADALDAADEATS